MRQLQSLLLLLILQALVIFANVEKITFLGPSSLTISTGHPTLSDLKLHALSPQHTEVRTQLNAGFPTNSSRWGLTSWILLHNLSEGQRYELRVCWAATQPTSFQLQPYKLPEVFDSVELISSLAAYSESRLSEAASFESITPDISKGFKVAEYGSDQVQSVLLIQVHTAADYYTTNKTLMNYVPPVLVDIILDPYLFNIFPRSLVPTAGFLVIVTIISWYLAKYVAKWLQMVARTDEQKKND